MGDQSKYVSKLKDKKVLIIGGSSGIGFGVAEASVEHGANVFISSSNPKRLGDAVDKLQNAYPSAKDQIKGLQVDIGTPEKTEQNLKELLDKTGKLDHIVWTAADALAVKPIAEIDLKFLYSAQTTRFIGPVLLAKLAPQYLNPGPDSSIIFTTGSVSERPIPNWSVVNAFATGLHGLTRGLALDLKPIRVNLVSPGGVETPLWDGLPEEQRKQLFESFNKTTTTGVIGSPEDVAESYIYLMKDKNVSGSVISTNGGALLLGPH